MQRLVRQVTLQINASKVGQDPGHFLPVAMIPRSKIGRWGSGAALGRAPPPWADPRAGSQSPAGPSARWGRTICSGHMGMRWGGCLRCA